MATRVYKSAVIVIHEPPPPVVRVYKSGVIVIHESAVTVALTQAIAEDTDNYLDAVSLSLLAELTLTITDSITVLTDGLSLLLTGFQTLAITEDTDNYADAFQSFVNSLHFTEDLSSNWLDSISIIGLDYVLLIEDGIPAWTDSIQLLFDVPGLVITEDMSSNWLDAVSSSLFGVPTQSIGEDVSSFQGDAISMTMEGLMEIEEITNEHLNDDLDIQLGINLPLADTQEPNWGDAVTVALQSELTLQIGEDVDNFGDDITVRNNTRGAGADRLGMDDYLRRYLNDVE